MTAGGGTLHLGGTYEEMAAAEAEVVAGQAPGEPVRADHAAGGRRSVPRSSRPPDAVVLHATCRPVPTWT